MDGVFTIGNTLEIDIREIDKDGNTVNATGAGGFNGLFLITFDMDGSEVNVKRFLLGEIPSDVLIQELFKSIDAEQKAPKQ